MIDLIKVAAKLAIQMFVWVFILSISWNERTLFDRVKSVIIENSIVEAIDSEIADVWYKVASSAEVTFSDAAENQTDSM